jgi:hypothetical protein
MYGTIVDETDETDETESVVSDCVICLDPLEEQTINPFNCKHRLHKECFDNYKMFKTRDLHIYSSSSEMVQSRVLNVTCPQCKQRLVLEKRNVCDSLLIVLLFAFCMTSAGTSFYFMVYLPTYEHFV